MTRTFIIGFIFSGTVFLAHLGLSSHYLESELRIQPFSNTYETVYPNIEPGTTSEALSHLLKLPLHSFSSHLFLPHIAIRLNSIAFTVVLYSLCVLALASRSQKRRNPLAFHEWKKIVAAWGLIAVLVRISQSLWPWVG